MSDEDAEQLRVANFTHAWMRRVDDKLDKILEVLVRHDTRITRVERDVGELKVDFGGLENRMLTLTTDILRVGDSVDAMNLKLEAMNASLGRLDSKVDRLTGKVDRIDTRVANIEGKLDISPAFEPN
jgi:hypothetical protein